MFHLLRITSITVIFLIGAVFGSYEYLESYSIGWSSLDFTYPINASGVCLAIHNNTFYGFGGKQSGSSTSRVKTVYWLDIDNFTPNNENSNSIVWSSYQWQNDAYWAISGFQCFSNALIIDDYAYIVAPVDNDEVMMVFDTISKSQVDMSDYDYIMPYSVDTPCSTTDGSKIYVMGGTDLDVSSTYYKDLWEYDPILDKWTQLADMKVSGRQYGSCNYDSINNRIFIFGGFSSSGGILDSIEYYNIDNNEWILMDTTLRDERYHHSSLIYLNEYNFNNVYSDNNMISINEYDVNETIIENNNWVFILGGYDSTGTITDKTQIVNIDKMTIAKWSKSGNSDLPVAMRKFGAIWIEETKNNTNNNDTKVKVISKSIDNNKEQISIIIEKEAVTVGGFLSDSSAQITTNKIFYGVVTVNQTIIIDNTNEPTLYPSKMPSIMPTDATTTGMITTTTIAMVGGDVDTTDADSGSIISGNIINDESNSVNQESWQMASIGVLFLAILIPFVVIGVAYSFHNNGEWKGADSPDYVSIFVGFWQVADFYSDLLFCGMLFWDDNKLFIYCFIFTFGPHIVSNIVSLFQMYQWRQYTIYISKYVNHYDWFIIFLSATSGFYTAIELAQSRLFLWNIFGLQMRRDEYIKLRNYRFWNVVCFENAPQLIIQLLYINEMGTITLVTFNAMFFSIISLLFGTSRQLSQWFEHTSRLNREYVYRARKEYKMEIHNNSIKPYHEYIHKKFESLLSQILRVDTVNVDVFYIKTMRHGLFLYFEINNFRIANSNVNNKKNKDSDNNNNNSDETSHTSTAGMDVEKRVETMDIFEKVMNLESVALSSDENLKIKKECLASQFQNDMCNTFGLDFNSFVVTIKNSECDVEYDKRLQRIEMKTQSNNNNNSHNNNNNNNNTNNTKKDNSSYQSDNKVNVVKQESDINLMMSRPNLEAINSLSGSRAATPSNYNGMPSPMNFDFVGNIQYNNMNGVQMMNVAPMAAMEQQSINMNNQLQLQQQWMAMAMTMATQVAQPGSVNDAYNDMVNIATQKEGQHHAD